MDSFGMDDNVRLIKKNGAVIENIKASVQEDIIYIDNPNFAIEVNDIIERVLPIGATEQYKVVNPIYHAKSGSFNASYEVKCQKLGIQNDKLDISNITYNFHGHNSRVNNNSLDLSTNMVSINDEIAKQIEILRDEIKKNIIDINEKSDALEIVTALENHFKQEKPSRAVVNSLVRSLPTLASISSIGSFLISCIPQ
ncbi:hypothetical protein Sputw3181_2491 [Shewanella sp. W3-18-1]|uniref:hypothetical protein n=1 Tax=Shewanella sp. (strain W3-18-1) TaxID=351745 RepID=UPI00005FC44C|nr:hypothetical protein [Shewanella sp. W3-18-1]ABM25315.1 hypothetical protein Sputw3181_2491 [Shewanella sp. W3-18-1]